MKTIAAALSKDDTRPQLSVMRVADGIATATDGHRLHQGPTGLRDGYVDAAGRPTELPDGYTFPDVSRVIPADPVVLGILDVPRALIACKALKLAEAGVRKLERGSGPEVVQAVPGDDPRANLIGERSGASFPAVLFGTGKLDLRYLTEALALFPAGAEVTCSWASAQSLLYLAAGEWRALVMPRL